MDEHIDVPEQSPGPDRRTLLRSGAVVGVATLWTAPLVQTIAAPAFAVGSPRPGTGTVSGVVADGTDGAPISGATVTGPGGATTTTDPDGRYALAGIPVGTHSFTASAPGFQAQTLSRAIADGPNTLNFGLARNTTDRIVTTLSWGDRPADLDLHMAGPRSGGRPDFHVYYPSSNRTSGPGNDVTLDVDDVDGAGPENQTIRMEPMSSGFVPGRYRVWVHNFTNRRGSGDDFSTGTATLTLTGLAGQVLSLNEDTATGSVTKPIWRGYEFTLDSAGTISGLTTLNFFDDGSDSTVF